MKYPRLPDLGFAAKPQPFWWRFAHRYLWRVPRLVGWANQLYAWQYGFWAPSIFDAIQSTPLHELSSTVAADWTK